MAHDVVMPKWGDTMLDGLVVEWGIAVGDAVHAGQEIATIETEKVEAALEAPHDGTVVEIVVSAGEVADVGAVLARIEPL